MIEFIQITDYPNYEVNNVGEVRNIETLRILKSFKNNQGYFNVNLCKNGIKKEFLVHRLVALAFIENPENKLCVDHRDGNKTNNNLTNLRWATLSENSRNRKIDITNTSGTKGVSFYKRNNKWRTQIRINEKNIHLGYFETIEDAIEARQTKALEIFGEFVNDCEKL